MLCGDVNQNNGNAQCIDCKNGYSSVKFAKVHRTIICIFCRMLICISNKKYKETIIDGVEKTLLLVDK